MSAEVNGQYTRSPTRVDITPYQSAILQEFHRIFPGFRDTNPQLYYVGPNYWDGYEVKVVVETNAGPHITLWNVGRNHHVSRA